MATIETIFKISAAVTGGNAVKELSREIDKVSTNGERLKRTFSQVGVALRGLAAGVAVSELARLADQSTLINERLKQSTRSTQEFNQAFKGLAQASRETGASMKDAIDVFQRISFVRDELKATVEEMVTFTATVQKMGVLSGASGEEMANGLRQLGQALSAGVVRAEEFNSVVENTPIIAKAIADQFGVTTGQLRQLVVKGLVDSADVFAAVLNQSQQVADQYAKMPNTIGRGLASLSQDFMNIVGMINESTGATEVLTVAFKGVSFVAKGLALGITTVFDVVATAIKAAANSINGILNDIIRGINTVLAGVANITGTAPTQLREFQMMQGTSLGGVADRFMSNGDKLFGATDALPGAATGTRKIGKDYAKLAAGLRDPDAQKKADQAARKMADTEEDLAKKIATIRAETAALELNNFEKEKAKTLAEFEARGIKTTSAAYKELEGAINENNAAKRSWRTGAVDALNEYIDAATNAAQQTKDVFGRALKSIEDFFVEFATTGKLTFKDLARSIISDLVRIQVQQSITGPLASAMKGGSFLNSIGSIFGFANGGVMTGNGPMPLRAYARGGIANSPQLALYGEGSMAEAYVPLPDGRSIPVTMRGAGGATNVAVTVNMTGTDDVQASNRQGAELGKMIGAVVKQTLINEKRPGGLLAAGA